MTINQGGATAVLSDRDVRAQEQVRRNAVGDTLRLTARLLGAPTVDLTWEDNGPAPGWTDGSTIWLNASAKTIKDNLATGWNADGIFVVTALAYHELAHVLFTPRMNSAPAVHARETGKWMAFNILEDQRAESMFVALYGPARSYFTALVVEFLADTKEQVESNYALVAGRLFLPKTLRKFFRDRFAKPHLLGELEAIVHEYRRLDLPTSNDRAIELIDAFHALLNAMGPTKPQTDHDPDGMTSGRTAPVGQQRDLADKQDDEDLTGEPVMVPAEPGDDDEDGDEGATGAAGGDETDDETDDGFAPGLDGEDVEQDDTLEPSEGGDHGEGGQPSDEDDDAQDGDASTSTGGSGEAAPGEPSLDDLLEQAEREAREDVADEVDSRLESARKREGGIDAAGTEQDSSQCIRRDKASPEMFLAARRVEREWKRMAEALEAGWDTQQRSGKFNVLRTMRSERTGRTDVFDRWVDGVDNLTDAEVVILLDQSSSMGRNPGPGVAYHAGFRRQRIGQASEAVWVLRRAITRTGGRCTVLGFSQQAGEPLSWGSRSNGYSIVRSEGYYVLEPGNAPLSDEVRYFKTHSSTHAATALDEARVVLDTSKRRNKVIVLVTDGDFSDRGQVKQFLASTNHRVLIVGIGAYTERYLEPLRTYRSVVAAESTEDATGLVPVVREAVKKMMRQVAQRGGRR